MITSGIDFTIDDDKQEIEIHITSEKQLIFTIKDLITLLKGNKDISKYNIISITYEKVKEN